MPCHPHPDGALTGAGPDCPEGSKPGTSAEGGRMIDRAEHTTRNPIPMRSRADEGDELVPELVPRGRTWLPD